LEKAYGLGPLVAKIRADGKATGVVASPDGKMLVAYGHLQGPQWILITTFPKTITFAESWSQLASNFLAKFLVVAIGAAILFGMVRRLVIQPLQALGEPAADTHAELTWRTDEI